MIYKIKKTLQKSIIFTLALLHLSLRNHCTLIIIIQKPTCFEVIYFAQLVIKKHIILSFLL